MNKDILYCDMDGVICCFETGVKAYEPKMKWEREDVDRVCEANPRLFLTLPEIEGAKQALNKLNEKFDIYFLSTPMWNIPESYMDKRIYIESMFPWAEKKLILTHNKGLLKGNFIIDDRTVNGVDKFQGYHIHYGTEKFPNWETITNFLL